MKSFAKRILSAAVAIVCLLTCIFAVSACDGKGDGKIVNAEFGEFLEKVTAVLSDYDITINKETDFSGGGSSPAGAVISAAGYEENKSAIINLITQDEDVIEDTANVFNARQDIFEQSLYAGIIIGDGITTYHKEKNFYGIPVYIEEWHQYFEVTKDNNSTYVRCYTMESENTSESCISLRLDFNSSSDYSFVFIQSSVSYGVTYAYGNSQKEFLTFSYAAQNPEGCFAMYSDAADNGYYLVSQTAAANIKNFFDTEINAVKPGDFLPLKNSRYTLNKTQTDEVMQKYFKSSPSSSGGGRENGLATQSYNGMTVAQYFVADGETELIIPEGVNYIVKRFVIETEGQRIKKLTLPASLKGVVQEKEGEGIVEGGNRYIEYEEVELNDLSIECRDNVDGDFYILEEVAVASSNTVYKSEGGHLLTKDGKLVYLVNAPKQNFDISYVFNDEVKGYIEDGLYDNFVADVTEISITSEHIKNDVYNAISSLLEKTTALQTLNLTTYDMQGDNNFNVSFMIDTGRDIAINAKLNSANQNIAVMIKEKDAPVTVSLNLIEMCEAERSVLDILNINEASGETVGTSNISIYANCNELDYIIKYAQSINIEGFATQAFDYAQRFESEGFIFRALYDYGNVYGLELTEFEDGGEIQVPGSVEGVDIDVLLLPAELLKDKTLSIILPKRMEIHIVTYGAGGSYPYVQGLKFGQLINENITINLPYDNIEGGIDVTSLRHLLHVVYTNTDEIIADSNTYEELNKVNLTVLVGENERNIYNVLLALDSNRAEMSADELDGYTDWENLTLIDDDGNLYPVTIAGDKAYFYVPKDITDRQLRIVGDNEVALTINLMGDKALEVVIPKNYQLTLKEEINSDGSRDLYYAITVSGMGDNAAEYQFAFALPDEKTIGYMVTYDYHALWYEYGRKASVELEIRDVEYYDITFYLRNPYKDGDEVIKVSRFAERERIIFPEVQNTFVDSDGNNLQFKCWMQYNLEFYPENNLTAGQDEHYTAVYIEDRTLNIAFMMQGREVASVEIREDKDFIIREVIDKDSKVRSVYFNLYEDAQSQLICEIPQGKMLAFESNKFEFYNILSQYGSNAEIILEIVDVEYYEITFAIRSPINPDDVTTINIVRVEKGYNIVFPDVDEYIRDENALFKFRNWVDQDGGGVSDDYELAYRDMTYYAIYELDSWIDKDDAE